MPGGCKYGKSCKYSHHREERGAQLNTSGLPLRPVKFSSPVTRSFFNLFTELFSYKVSYEQRFRGLQGEPDCQMYMLTSFCEFTTNCHFHHPEPAFQAIQHQQNCGFGEAVEHNGFYYDTAEVSSYHLDHEDVVACNTETSAHSCVPSEETERRDSASPEEANYSPGAMGFPQEPDRPDCLHFIEFGVCHLRSSCRFHHPNGPACALNDLGLPLRPGQPACLYFDRYGICKYGASCKFDHPICSSIPY